MKLEVSLTISVKRSSDHCKNDHHQQMLDTKSCDKADLSGVHLVDSDDELTDTEGEGKESVFTGLTILGDTGCGFTSTTSNDEDAQSVRDSTIILGGTSEVRGLELPESDINGDIMLTLGRLSGSQAGGEKHKSD